MRRTKLWLMLMSAALCALVVFGCAGGPEGAVGTLCAGAEGGAQHCVTADRSPSVAWKEAENDGELPIEMWAERPESITLDELVENEAQLRAWFGDIDDVTSYLTGTQRNAESYRASLGGNLGRLVGLAADRQAERLAQKPVDAAGNFQRAMIEKANAEKAPLVAALAADKQAMAAAEAAVAIGARDVAPLKEQFARMVAEFTAYRATEAAETATYASLARQASASTLETIAGVEQAVVSAGRDASSRSGELATTAMRISAELQAFEVRFQTALAPHADFLARHGVALPDMTSGALRSLNAMLGYVQRRVARSDATATSLLGGIEMRRQALALLRGGRAMRDAVATSRLARASSTFGDGARARVETLQSAPPESAKLRLPYLAARHDQIKALLQLQPLCEASSSSWREAGCVSLRGRFGEAQAYLQTTLPRLIANGVAAMRGRGVEEKLLDVVARRLAAGDVKGAAIAYDVAVKTSEGT